MTSSSFRFVAYSILHKVFVFCAQILCIMKLQQIASIDLALLQTINVVNHCYIANVKWY